MSWLVSVFIGMACGPALAAWGPQVARWAYIKLTRLGPVAADPEQLPSPEILAAYAEVDAELRSWSGEFDRKLRVAQRVLGLAKPFCDRLAIVGSLRRGAPEPGDVDILAVIKTDGVAPQHPRTPHLIGVIAELDPTVTQPHDHHIRFHLDGVKVDIILTDDTHWGMHMIQYTGSREFNALVQARAKALGYTVRERDIGKHEGSGYSRTFISHTNGKTEDAILQVLGLSRYTNPTHRSYTDVELTLP